MVFSFSMECNACQVQFAIQTFHPLLSEKPALLLHCQVDGCSPRVAKSQARHCGPHQTWQTVRLSQTHFSECALGIAAEGWLCFNVVKIGGLPWLRSGLS